MVPTGTVSVVGLNAIFCIATPLAPIEEVWFCDVQPDTPTTATTATTIVMNTFYPILIPPESFNLFKILLML